MTIQEILRIRQSKVVDIIRNYLAENDIDPHSYGAYGNGTDRWGSVYLKKLFTNNPELLKAFETYSFNEYGELVNND